MSGQQTGEERRVTMLPPSPECMVCEPALLDDPPLFLRPRTDLPPPGREEQP